MPRIWYKIWMYHTIVKSVINKYTFIKKFANYICIKIKFVQKKYKIIFYWKTRYLSILIDYFLFISLKKKFSYSTIAIIFCKLNATIIHIENINYQIYFGIKQDHTAIIKPL